MKEFFRTTGVVLFALIIAGSWRIARPQTMERPSSSNRWARAPPSTRSAVYSRSGASDAPRQVQCQYDCVHLRCDADYVYWCGEGVTTAANGDKLFLYVLGKTSYAEFR